WRARSDRSPSARACRRQAMRLMSQVRLLARVGSWNNSAKRGRNSATVIRARAATSLVTCGSIGVLLFAKSRDRYHMTTEHGFAAKLKANCKRIRGISRGLDPAVASPRIKTIRVGIALIWVGPRGSWLPAHGWVPVA